MTHCRALQDFRNMNQVLLHRNDKINLPVLSEAHTMMALYMHTHSVPCKRLKFPRDQNSVNL
jgi:hypothetical protein